MSDRHGCALETSRGLNLGTKLLRERLDDASAETGFSLSKDAVRPADTIVADRKLPVRPSRIIRHCDLTLRLFVGECMLQGIHDELGYD